MRVLIVENELYLAQSISSKLSDIGFNCEITATVKDAIQSENFDIILLSTNVSGQNFQPIINRYKNSIIILMISYISNDTVSNPLKAGANDYILKPFMIEELIRKIELFIDYENLKREAKTYQNYIEFNFDSISSEELKIDTKESLPLFVKSNYQKYADFFAFEFARVSKMNLEFISLLKSNWKDELKSTPKNSIIYLTPFGQLKKSEKSSILESIKDLNVIISTMDNSDELDINTIELKSDSKIFDRGNILSIDDYIKFIVINYQTKYPDTELSKKLGISRKSLWEKRKKYGIIKKK